MPLTDVQIRNAKPKDKPYRLTDGEGMYLEVSPSGGKLWRLKYRFGGKENRLAFGSYPAVPLKGYYQNKGEPSEIYIEGAREKRAAARALLAAGIDPSAKRKEDRVAEESANAHTFRAVAEEWMHHHPPKTASTKAKTEWLLNFAYVELGNLAIKSITPPQVLAVCRKEEAKGHLETAQRIKVKCSQVFRYGVATGKLERDPTTDLRGALATPVVKSHAAIIEPVKVGELLRAMDGYSGQFVTVCALKLAPLVFIRPGELRAAKWADVNLEEALWCYTPPKTRNQTQVDHIVPLSSQAVETLRELHYLTGHGTYLFPSLRTPARCMSENTVNAALRRLGYSSEEMCGHGFRATARTILEEVLGFRIELIEQQLAHMVKDANGRAYNRTTHLPERTRMMQAWADYLDKIKASAVVIPFKRQA